MDDRRITVWAKTIGKGFQVDLFRSTQDRLTNTQCSVQRRQMSLVQSPTTNRSIVKRLTDLPGTGGLHNPICSMKVQTGRIPRKPQKIDDCPTLPLQVMYCRFIICLDHSKGKDFPPGAH